MFRDFYGDTPFGAILPVLALFPFPPKILSHTCFVRFSRIIAVQFAAHFPSVSVDFKVIFVVHGINI